MTLFLILFGNFFLLKYVFDIDRIFEWPYQDQPLKTHSIVCVIGAAILAHYPIFSFFFIADADIIRHASIGLSMGIAVFVVSTAQARNYISQIYEYTPTDIAENIVISLKNSSIAPTAIKGTLPNSEEQKLLCSKGIILYRSILHFEQLGTQFFYLDLRKLVNFASELDEHIELKKNSDISSSGQYYFIFWAALSLSTLFLIASSISIIFFHPMLDFSEAMLFSLDSMLRGITLDFFESFGIPNMYEAQTIFSLDLFGFILRTIASATVAYYIFSAMRLYFLKGLSGYNDPGAIKILIHRRLLLFLADLSKITQEVDRPSSSVIFLSKYQANTIQGSDIEIFRINDVDFEEYRQIILKVVEREIERDNNPNQEK